MTTSGKNNAALCLSAEHVTKIYGGRTIIRDISVHLDEGELVSLLGLSGSGKTTLFQILSGLSVPDEGRVLLKGEEMTGHPGRVGYMLQKDLLLPHKKVIDNVSLPMVLRGVKKEEARRAAEPYFAEFGLDGTQLQYPSQLSGGMRQRAALLRTYLAAEGVALLDEPFSALDMITKGQMHAWYQDVMERIRLSTLLITHDVDEAILLSDRIYLLTGSPGEIRHELQIRPPRSGRKDFNLTPAFLDYKREILEILEKRG